MDHRLDGRFGDESAACRDEQTQQERPSACPDGAEKYWGSPLFSMLGKRPAAREVPLAAPAQASDNRMAVTRNHSQSGQSVRLCTSRAHDPCPGFLSFLN
ncbi:hypothetical protein THTE_0743 [Thermogutta terrifontis]|uniref:Uncharacterized protein n=1 Tax=Thermogutta terrifontis TaxID=1331910 RepID=A0A286RBM0_9BACT|nr:hypothetical protein THTE_0743 [Thermogutta terrifontis]